jgi:ribulose-5-phosphate 4-epimerase/fuculose-1-phosphate aldolase
VTDWDRHETVLRREVTVASRILTWSGLMDQSGHISVRLGEDSFLIVSRPVSRRVVRPEQQVVMRLDGTSPPGQLPGPSEWPIHASIYRARPEVKAVAHIHSRMITNVGLSGRPLVAVCVHGGIFGPDPVPVFDMPDLIQNVELGDALAEALGGARAVIMRGHGSVVVGESTRAAVAGGVYLEENADRLWHAAAIGTPRAMSREECDRVVAQSWTRAAHKKVWDHLVAEASAAGYLAGLTPEDVEMEAGA